LKKAIASAEPPDNESSGKTAGRPASREETTP
jgi:hypothetical protein